MRSAATSGVCIEVALVVATPALLVPRRRRADPRRAPLLMTGIAGLDGDPTWRRYPCTGVAAVLRVFVGRPVWRRGSTGDVRSDAARAPPPPPPPCILLCFSERQCDCSRKWRVFISSLNTRIYRTETKRKHLNAHMIATSLRLSLPQSVMHLAAVVLTKLLYG